MKVTGFTFVKNAVKFDYPVVEAIKSILPICDDFVVAAGNSEDSTTDLIRGIDNQKMKIVETVWDTSPEMLKKGMVYSSETNKAIQAITADSDWAFYIQGDEIIHEKYLDVIYSAMEKWKDNPKVEGLLFNYLHFYGSYDYFGLSPEWYTNEIRVIRNNKSIYSFRDAQGFRTEGNRKLNVKPVDAWVYHYGWVKEPSKMRDRLENTLKFYHDINWLKKLISEKDFDYSSRVEALGLFRETHPAVMQERINRKNWTFEHDISFNRLSFRHRAKIFIKEYFGIDTFYQNYKVI